MNPRVWQHAFLGKNLRHSHCPHRNQKFVNIHQPKPLSLVRISADVLYTEKFHTTEGTPVFQGAITTYDEKWSDVTCACSVCALPSVDNPRMTCAIKIEAKVRRSVAHSFKALLEIMDQVP